MVVIRCGIFGLQLLLAEAAKSENRIKIIIEMESSGIGVWHYCHGLGDWVYSMVLYCNRRVGFGVGTACLVGRTGLMRVLKLFIGGGCVVGVRESSCAMAVLRGQTSPNP